MESEVVYLIILSMFLVVLLYSCGICYFGKAWQKKDNPIDEFQPMDSHVISGIFTLESSQMAEDLIFPPKYSNGLSREFEEPPPSYECAVELDRMSKIPKINLDIETYI